MNYEKIGEFIAEKRKEKNLTQVELARKLGVTDKAVSKWERGLGCPDVSILEILSKELDVSILELLKGRKIENEVINITEADDYIKKSYNFTTDKYNEDLRKILNIILIFLSSFIVVMIIYFNISSYIRITKKEDMDFTYSYEDINYALGPGTSFYDNKDKLKKYIDIIENNKGTLTDEDHEKLLTFLKGEYKFINESFLFKINKTTYYSFNDIFVNLAKEGTKYDLKYLYFSQVYQEYVGDISKTDFYRYITSSMSSIDEFSSVYNSNFQNQLYFKVEDDTFRCPLFMLLSIVDTHINILNPITSMTEDIMKAANIYE
jgi:transcriptional regulator with XRE-family HTH domain